MGQLIGCLDIGCTPCAEGFRGVCLDPNVPCQIAILARVASYPLTEVGVSSQCRRSGNTQWYYKFLQSRSGVDRAMSIGRLVFRFHCSSCTRCPQLCGGQGFIPNGAVRLNVASPFRIPNLRPMDLSRTRLSTLLEEGKASAWLHKIQRLDTSSSNHATWTLCVAPSALSSEVNALGIFTTGQ